MNKNSIISLSEGMTVTTELEIDDSITVKLITHTPQNHIPDKHISIEFVLVRQKNQQITIKPILSAPAKKLLGIL